MSEDEKKDETTEETPVQDEDAQSAGPDAEEATSPSDDASGDDATSTPPAEDAPSADDGSDDAPAPEAGGGDASDEDELPWKEKRRLERSRKPHQAGPKLSIEERAAKRAEARKAKATLRRKQRADAKANRGEAGVGTPPAERTANAAKVRQGVVMSDKGEKSITVRIDIVRRHPTYEKVVRSSRTLHAHDEQNEANKGDIVRVVETRPLSKTKRWRLVDVVERAR
jgi:small subunit ribosomal protein S17